MWTPIFFTYFYIHTGWLYLRDQGLLGVWAARWITVRPGVLSIHAAGPRSIKLFNNNNSIMIMIMIIIMIIIIIIIIIFTIHAAGPRQKILKISLHCDLRMRRPHSDLGLGLQFNIFFFILVSTSEQGASKNLFNSIYFL